MSTHHVESAKSSPVLVMEEISLQVGNRSLVDGFSLQLMPGEKVALVGPSGSGKSTLMACVLGFVQPQHGRILLDGEDLDSRSVWRLRQKLAYVAQEPDLGSGTVQEAYERMFGYRANRELKGNLDRVPDLFQRFGLEDSTPAKKTKELSGGEKQRVALVGALLLDRPLLLLDEASSALDDTSKAAVADYLSERGDLTVLVVSHDRPWLSFTNRQVDLADFRKVAP